ncbi:MAG: hypothetical protein RLZZ292_2756, partial [Bacteroidota bacterium]
SSKKFTLSDIGVIELNFVSIIAPKCFGTATGSITVQATPGYTYAWSNGTTGTALTNLVSGNYVVTVTGNGCSATKTITIDSPPPVSLGTLAATNPKCFGDTNGSIAFLNSDPGLSYIWSNAATTASLTNLGVGTYSVTASNGFDCKTTETIALTQPTSIFPALTSVAPKCFGDATGKITISNPLNDCVYTWSTGTVGTSLSNVTAGTYSITVTNSVTGCTATNNATIVDPPLLTIGNIATTSPKCFGEATGKLEIQNPPTGATYLWSNNATGATLNNILAGTYTVTATDSNGCKASKNVTLTQLPAIVINNVLTTDPLCFGATNGSIQVQTTNTGLSYVWSNNANTNTLSNVGAGTYTVSISDANGCKVTKTAILSQPAEIALGTIVPTSPLCLGDKNGKIEVTNPTLGVTYTWSNGIIGALVNNLEAGTYTVTGSNANGCTKIETVTVATPVAPNIGTINSIAPTCFGNANGSIAIQNPTAGLTFTWSNGVSGATNNNLVAGDYTLTVTNTTGCKSTKTVTLTQPNQVTVSAATTKTILCFGEKTSLEVQNPSANLTYSWSNNLSGTVNANVGAGTYSVTASDANNCKAYYQLTVTEPTALAIGNATIQNAHVGVIPPDGSISLGTAVTGGTGATTYLWSNAATTTTLSNLDGGTYTVTVTDANGCTVSKNFTVQLLNAVESLENAGILLSIVPNPSDASQKSYLSVKTIANTITAKCIISDYTGKEISSETMTLIEGTKLPLALPNVAGVFVVRVVLVQEGKEKQQSWKVVRY